MGEEYKDLKPAGCVQVIVNQVQVCWDLFMSGLLLDGDAVCFPLGWFWCSGSKFGSSYVDTEGGWLQQKLCSSFFNKGAKGHLRGHPADGWYIISSVQEVSGVLFELELTQPLIDGFCILKHTQTLIHQVIHASKILLLLVTAFK